MRNQVGAIVGAVVHLFVVETVIHSVPATRTPAGGMPGGAAGAMLPDLRPVELLEP